MPKALPGVIYISAAAVCRQLRLKLNVEGDGQNSDTLFLPESLTTGSPSAYRVLVMQQIGMRECDTLQFRMNAALARLPQLAAIHTPSPEAGPRVGDYRLLFDCFSAPAIAEDLFLLFEDMRIQSHLLRHYPAWQNTLPIITRTC